ncbi:hypothetical protein ACA910_000556 [Epithemia clementina (nom. ined.)]
MVAATAVADLAAQALKEAASSKLQQSPPPPLPPGWLLKESKSHPNAYYYYNQDTGESTWNPPASMLRNNDEEPGTAGEQEEDREDEKMLLESILPAHSSDAPPVKMESLSDSDVASDRKRPHEDTLSSRPIKMEESNDNKSVPEKRRKTAPSQVRVLHILKKHKDSRRPSSWRTNNKPITITREEAIDELKGLLDILREEEYNPENLVATFKELASQESDCSSAKRNGDLGMFGRKKMRPEFEAAAFGLEINQLSDVVETASGAHILLRLE